MTTTTTEARSPWTTPLHGMARLCAAYEAFTFCQEQTDGRDLTREAEALSTSTTSRSTNHDDVACSILEENRDAALSVEVPAAAG